MSRGPCRFVDAHFAKVLQGGTVCKHDEVCPDPQALLRSSSCQGCCASDLLSLALITVPSAHKVMARSRKLVGFLPKSLESHSHFLSSESSAGSVSVSWGAFATPLFSHRAAAGEAVPSMSLATTAQHTLVCWAGGFASQTVQRSDCVDRQTEGSIMSCSALAVSGGGGGKPACR